MGGGKKIAVVVVLLVVIVAVIAFTMKRQIAGPKPPAWVMEREVQKIDAETNTLITKTMGEWKKLGHEEGKYKHPETGKYTCVTPMECASCGKWIPQPEVPRGLEEEGPAALDEIYKDYKCPLCGEPAFGERRGK